MKLYTLTLFLLILTVSVHAQGTKIQIDQTGNGIKLLVDGQDFMINGMNWDYYPIGTNYTYSLWDQPEENIKAVLEDEMTLLKDMGVNALRIYTGIPGKWIAYIHEHYGIYTMLNHPFGRYGILLDDEWIENTDYANAKVQGQLIKEATQLAKEYNNTPGLLLYLLGNENNYGLFYEEPKKIKTQEKEKGTDLETRAMYKLFLFNNQDDSEQQQEDNLSLDQLAAIRARAMYTLFNKAALSMKSIDTTHPIAISNGDLMFMDIIKEECSAVDIFGTNMYRGISFGDTFERVKQELNKPFMFTEVGADAYHAIEKNEDQESQAYYLLGNWKEIYANAAGIGGAENSIGGFTFQFSDGWWKFNMTMNLDVHDNIASWHNAGYYRDDKDGVNNMNEEWFGVCAKVKSNPQGAYKLAPRAAYFVLQKAHKFSPYDPSTTSIDLNKHFTNIGLTKSIEASKDYREALTIGN